MGKVQEAITAAGPRYQIMEQRNGEGMEQGKRYDRDFPRGKGLIRPTVNLLHQTFI